MLDLPALFKKYHIPSLGVVHVGAHEGQEVPIYQSLRIRHTLFIEANPAVAKRFAAKWSITPVVKAVTDHNGFIDLHVMSNDQSSSILPLGYHATMYPAIVPVQTINVECATLDTIIDEIDGGVFNFLHLDIQGAELLALKGATELIRHLDAIVCEVNTVEMYKGCPLVGEIDAYLTRFERVQTDHEFGPQWGDAFYVRKSHS